MLALGSLNKVMPLFCTNCSAVTNSSAGGGGCGGFQSDHVTEHMEDLPTR